MRDIRRRTRKHYSAEEKIRVVLAGLRGEDSIAEGIVTLTRLAKASSVGECATSHSSVIAFRPR